MNTISCLQPLRQPGSQQQILEDASAVPQRPIDVQRHHDRHDALLGLTQERDVGFHAQGIGTRFTDITACIGECTIRMLIRFSQSILMDSQLRMQAEQQGSHMAVTLAQVIQLREIPCQGEPVSRRQMPLRSPRQRLLLMRQRIWQKVFINNRDQSSLGIRRQTTALQADGPGNPAFSFARPIVQRGSLTHGFAEAGFGGQQITPRKRLAGQVVMAHGR